MQRLGGGEEVGGPAGAGAAAHPVDRARRPRSPRSQRRRRRAPARRHSRRRVRARPRSAPSRAGAPRQARSPKPRRAAPRAGVCGSAQASRTLAPEPAVIGRRAPTGTVSRRPVGGSIAATQIRCVPSRRYSCTLSPVISRSRGRTRRPPSSERVGGAARRVRRAPGPGRHRPSASRRSSRCTSRPDGQPVRGRPGQSGAGAQLGEAAGLSRPRRAGRPPLCPAPRSRYAVP